MRMKCLQLYADVSRSVDRLTSGIALLSADARAYSNSLECIATAARGTTPHPWSVRIPRRVMEHFRLFPRDVARCAPLVAVFALPGVGLPLSACLAAAFPAIFLSRQFLLAGEGGAA